jgi:hypothetical protein
MAWVIFPMLPTPDKAVRVTKREVFILALGILLSSKVALAPVSIVWKAGILSTVMAFSVVFAIGRNLPRGEPIEVYLIRRITSKFPNLHVPSDDMQDNSAAWQLNEDPDIRPDYLGAEALIDRERQAEALWVTPIPLTWKSLLYIPVASGLLTLLLWIWSGGP